jgi:hypothetical protein
MVDVEDRTFVGQTVRLDGRRFVACAFEGCRLVYAGGDAAVENCTFTDCTWDVQDAAANTVLLLEQVRRSGAPVPPGPEGLGDGASWRDPSNVGSTSRPSGEGSTAGFEAGRRSIGHQWADYAEWAVVALVAAALLLTLFLRA